MERRSGARPFIELSEDISVLLPARRRVRFGDARARASFRKVGRALKEVWDARSYTNIAPAAPR